MLLPVLWYDDNIFKIIRVKQELVITERRIKVDNIEQLTTKAEENDDNAIGIPENTEKAIALWQQAAAQGHGSAKAALETIGSRLQGDTLKRSGCILTNGLKNSHWFFTHTGF